MEKDYKKLYEEEHKKYEDALGRARGHHSVALHYSIANEIQELEHIFPELKESEGERIRKELISLIKETHVTDRYYDLNKMLAWLEKQGEQEPVEQKPTWSEEDEMERERVVGLLEGWLSTFKETYYAKDCKRGIGWLKSLKDRVQPQDKQGWSEEDEEMFDAIIADILFTQKAHPHEANQAVFEREIDWLKSVKERVTPTNKNDFDRGYEVGASAAKFNQWKPTNEQLEALEWSLGDYRNVIFEERHDTLVSLYNNLKKLKGE